MFLATMMMALSYRTALEDSDEDDEFGINDISPSGIEGTNSSRPGFDDDED